MGTHRYRLLGSSLAVLAALAAAPAARGQNLLANPEFDEFGSGNSASDPFPAWDSRVVVPTAGQDADVCPDSDSHSQEANSQASGAIATTCVPVTPNETIHLEVSYRSSAPFEMRLLQSPNDDCTSAAVPIPLPPPDIPANADWTIVRDQRTLGPNTHSVLLWLRGLGEGSYFLQLDRVYLGRAERIFADDWDGGLCRWTIVEGGAEP